MRETYMWDLIHIRTPFQVRKKVLSLMSVDLLRQQAKWKETLKEIRQIMTGVEQEGFTNLKVGWEVMESVALVVHGSFINS